MGRPKKLEREAKDPGRVKRITNTGGPDLSRTGLDLKRVAFNGAVDYEKNLENAGIKSKKWITKPKLGQKHRITDGKYKGEMCKVHNYVNESTFCEVEFCDAFGQPNGKRDLIPVKFLSWLSGVGSRAE